MTENYYLLNDAARILGRKPHQITYALATGQVAEPALRLGNKRVFTEEDLRRLGLHFKVNPKWPTPIAEQGPPQDTQVIEDLVWRLPFEAVLSRTGGHEVRDADGEVFCWAPDRGRALILAGLLESACGA